MPWRRHQWRYTLNAYRAAPVTFVRRVVLGQDSYWRQYFWSRWGYPPSDLRRLARGRRVLWIDVMSGGEVTQAVTFCRLLRAALPDWAIVVSTNNRYSFIFARRHLDVDFVFDTPWDCRGAVRRVLRQLRPTAFVCIQNISCPVLVHEARRAGVTTILTSGVMSKGVHLHPTFWRAMEAGVFRDFDWIGAWGKEDVSGFVARGAHPARVVVTGNLKFDFDFLRITEADRVRLRESLQLTEGAPVLLAASVHPGEEELVGRAYVTARRLIADLRLVVVPRYQFDAERWVTALQALGLVCERRTALSDRRLPSGAVLVVDTFGELSRLYAVASVVFLGGTTYCRNVAGLGQNPIEAIVQRKPLFFGPFMNLWHEITDGIKAAWPGVEVSSAKELSAGIVEVLTDRTLAHRLDQSIGELLGGHCSDVMRNVELVLQAVGAKRAGAAEAAS